MSASQPKPKARRGSEKRQKPDQILTRYSPEEYARVLEAASKAGLTPASYQRVQTLDTPPKTRSTRRAPIDRELLAKVLGQLGKIGGNVNQIAHAAHLDRLLKGQLHEALSEMRDTLPVLLEALGRKP